MLKTHNVSVMREISSVFPGNVLKELVDPSGAVIFTNSFQLGDPTINTLELWGAEYQENDAILCRQDHLTLLQKIGKRERCPVSVVGTVLDCGKVGRVIFVLMHKYRQIGK